MDIKYIKESAQGYEVNTLHESIYGDMIAFLTKPNGEYIVAWAYDVKTGTWGQGHYFNDFAKAIKFYSGYFQ